MASNTLVANVRQFLSAHPPFSQMSEDDVDFVARNLELAYFARDEVLIEPSSGVPAFCYILKQGVVEGFRQAPGATGTGAQADVHLTPGEVFPVGALNADRPVSTVYRAAGDVFCWLLPKARFDELLRRSDPFLDFCKRRTAALLDLSNQALQATYAAQATQWRSMNAPLESMLRRAPVTCEPGESMRSVFERLEEQRVGAMLVVDREPGGEESVAGIFTRQDVIGRIVLPQLPLDTPIREVMSSPVLTLDASEPVSEAMLLMAERNIRHVPVMRDGRLAGVVTERDLFVLQRRSIRQIGDSIRQADTVGELAVVAKDIRQWSQALVAQGVAASFITRLISRLNDQLSVRLIGLVAKRRGVDLRGLCWLALGSEGREEQTIATDQDNGLILADEREGERDALVAFAREVNEALDACGYPLCKGGIMASNPRWCLTLTGWRELFDGWIERGDPDSLLNANIFFDFRALAGDASLAALLREHVTGRAAATPRFLKQMSDNALRNSPPQSWVGGTLGALFGAEQAVVDLKLNGTAPFVDGARLLALARRVSATNTAERFEALAADGHIRPEEARTWNDAFQFLQSLRLRVQHRVDEGETPENPNLLDTRELSELDRRILKEAFRQSRRLQQRLALDYPGR